MYDEATSSSNVAILTAENPVESLSDEWLNCLTHGIGLFLSVIGLILLIILPIQEGNVWRVASLLIYGLSLTLLYLASTLYHASKQSHIKKKFRILDHCAIYLLIAGSYTPFALLLFGGTLGWILFSVIWGLAALGIIFKLFYTHRFKGLSTAIYLVMGWLILFAMDPLMNLLDLKGLYWLIGGGLFYTVGVIFFIFDSYRFYHGIWHLFVMKGSFCHYMAIFFYV